MGPKKEVLEEVVNELLDEMTLGLCFELHRSCKIGTLFLDDMDEASEKHYEIVIAKGKDVFGHLASSKRQYDCSCPNCKHSVAAARFAPHLEKCMGMGGPVSRLSSRRSVMRSNRKSTDIETDDNSDDGDWSYISDRKGAKKAKKDRKSHSPKKSKHKSKQRDDDSAEMQRSQTDLKAERLPQSWDRGSTSPADSVSTVASVASVIRNNQTSIKKIKKKSPSMVQSNSFTNPG